MHKTDAILPQKAVQTCEQALTILHIKCNSLLVLYTLSFPARALSGASAGAAT